MLFERALIGKSSPGPPPRPTSGGCFYALQAGVDRKAIIITAATVLLWRFYALRAGVDRKGGPILVGAQAFDVSIPFERALIGKIVTLKMLASKFVSMPFERALIGKAVICAALTLLELFLCPSSGR